MKTALRIWFPAQVTNEILGSRLPWLALVFIAAVGSVRSCIHMFSPDGGAGSIAGMNLNNAGASEVILVFALWGSEQLIYALIQWVVVLRYRALTPLFWVIQLLETLGRMLVGHLKPVTLEHVAPGQVGDYVTLVIALLMIVVSLWTGAQALDAEARQRQVAAN